MSPAYKEFTKPVIFEIYQEIPITLYVPRYYGIEKFGLPRKDYLPVGLPMPTDLKLSMISYHINLRLIKKPWSVCEHRVVVFYNSIVVVVNVLVEGGLLS